MFSSSTKEKIRYLVPEILVDAPSVLKNSWRTFQSRALLRRNLKLRNSQSGEVFILGNGPSLKNFSLDSVGRRPVITMNHFERHPAVNRLNIVSHCVGEIFATSTWEDPSPMLQVPCKFFLFNLSAAQYFEDRPEENVYYYSSGRPTSWPFGRGTDLQKMAMQYQSTSQMAIVLALYMGFTKIYLAGLDHDWLVTRGSSPHFYDEEGLPPADLSAFSYLQMIEISRVLFRTYEKLRKVALENGSEIINLSNPTYLDVFPQTT